MRQLACKDIVALTELARQYSEESPGHVIQSRMRSRKTLEFLRQWENDINAEFDDTSSHSHDILQTESKDWFAYDLKDDPNREKPIKPTVMTPQGTTHRVVFNFNKRIEYNCIFHYFTHQLCQNSIKETGKDYYTSTVLYCNKPLSEYHVCLKFHRKPTCINVYSINHRKGTFLRKLTNCEELDSIFIYTDHITNSASWSILCYIFEW